MQHLAFARITWLPSAVCLVGLLGCVAQWPVVGVQQRSGDLVEPLARSCRVYRFLPFYFLPYFLSFFLSFSQAFLTVERPAGLALI